MMEILLCSRRLDSYVVWWCLGKLKMLYCRLGCRCEAKELEVFRG
jgi:hypothetical protein